MPRFYSTYEELKHFHVVIINAAQFRFYSTYEELKLCDSLYSGSEISKFLQYLWGIETFFNPLKAP